MEEDEQHMEELLGALDNEENESIMGLTSRKIKQQRNDILQRIQIKGKDLKLYHKKLKEYRYCEKPEDVRFGFYIRWIPLKNAEKIYLTNGGLVCDMKVIRGELHIICKNNYNQLMQIKFNESIIFQKLSDKHR